MWRCGAWGDSPIGTMQDIILRGITVAGEPHESSRDAIRHAYIRSFFRKTLGRYLISPVIGSVHPYAFSSSPKTRYPCLVYHSSFVFRTYPCN